MVTDQVKDKHIYFTTIKETTYENASPFQAVDCGQACEFLKEDSLSDDDNASWNPNNDMNDFNESIDNVPQTYIDPQMNKAEYVNLSLN